MSKLKTSLFSRTPSLLKIAGTLVASEVKSRVMNLDSAQKLQEKILLAKDMAEQLGNLKGAAMKLGQMLSIDAADYLPPEAMEVLSKLQKDVIAIDYSIIENQIKNELRDKFELIQISPVALAVASIGQVHLARYNGQDIVLKIQYPDIEKTIEADVKMMKFLMSKGSLLMQKSVDLSPLFDELKNTLISETDYILEGKQLERARLFFLNDERYKVPKYIPELSTKRVLAMEFMEGISFSEWLKTSPTKDEKQKIGRALYELFLAEFLSLGFVQTDPNPGNFLINNKGQIVLLDFGAAKDYDKSFIQSYTKLLQAAYRNDKTAVLECSFDFDLISRKESDQTLELYYNMMKCIIEPFRHDKPFYFGDQSFYEESVRYGFEISKQCKYSPPPEKLLFLHRKLGGVFQLLKKMDVSLNLHTYWKTHFANEKAPNAGT